MQINMAYLTLDLLCHCYAPCMTTLSTWTKTIGKYKEAGKKLLKWHSKKENSEDWFPVPGKNTLQLL